MNAGSSDCRGVSTPGHGQGEGPDGDKWSIDHAGYVGRGRSERSERSPLQSLLPAFAQKKAGSRSPLPIRY